MARTGRRPGPSDSRQAILSAARGSFAQRGYDGTTIRGVARDAAVDPALVHHFFGTKERLFAAAMELPVDPGAIVADLTAAGVDGLGERIVRTFVSVWDVGANRSPLLALIRSAVTNEAAADMLRGFLSAVVLGRVAAELELPDAALRASLVGSQLVGLIMVRYVVRVEPLASADADTVVATVGPTLQRYLTGEL